MTGSHTLTARWIFPVAGSPLSNGTITLRDDTIEAVSPRGDRSADVDLGNVAIVPGLVNAHTHLDLSVRETMFHPRTPAHFTDWLRGVIAYRRSHTAEQVHADIQAGLTECLRHGTTLLGDISADGGSWDSIAAAELRGVVFRELIGLSEERAKAAKEAGWAWYQAHSATDQCKPALSPHSPYSARESLILGAGDERCAVAIHLAESPGEMELIRSHTGPFVSFLQQLGAWDEGGLVRSIGQIMRNRMSDHALFIHGNYLMPEDAGNFNGGMSLVYCPRTHAAFRHPPHPFREFLACGARVCLGTDSLASNPDLDILGEARFLHRICPDFPKDQLLRMITLSGAEALGWSDACGSLEVGKSADLVVVPLPDREGDPHELLMQDHAASRRTMFRGEWRT